MMKILVAVASKHGSTREIGGAVAEQLRKQGFSADLRNAEMVSALDDYSAVIVGSAVYAGNWLPEAKQFAERYRTALAHLPVWVFSSGPLGAENPQPHDDPTRLAAPLGEVKIRDHRVFVGKLDPDDLGFAERMIVKAFRAPTGDFRDWEAIRGWADEVAAALRAETLPS